MKIPIPLSKRRIDSVSIAFFVPNLTFITCIVDLEQLVVAGPGEFESPLWPFPFLIDLRRGHSSCVLARSPSMGMM